MTNDEYNALIGEILLHARGIVSQIERLGPDHASKMTGWDEKYLRYWTHHMHKLAVKLARVST